MKQLLLITAISCVCCTQVFAGSSCKTCPTAPAQDSKEKTTDAKEEAKEATAPNALLAANDCSVTTTPAPTQTDGTNPDMTDDMPQDGAMQQKNLLAGGTAPSNADAPTATGEEKKDEEMKKKTTETQLVA